MVPLAVVAATAVGLGLSIDPASAAFPGSNGKIAFDRYLSGTGPSERKAIDVINPNGSGLRRLTAGREPNWSANGKKLVLVRPGKGGVRSIFTMNANGKNVRRLTNSKTFDQGPAWSPDGKHIVFVRSPLGHNGQPPGPGDIYTMNANGTHVRRLTKTPRIHEDGPAWSPNGKWIAYAALIGTTAHIFIIKPNGRGKHLLTSSGDLPDWSPNGKRIAFFRDIKGGPKIFIMSASGGRAHLVGPGRGLYGNNPAWSPNGKQIAFVGLSSRRFLGIFVMNSDGTHVRQLTVGGKTGDFGLNDANPSWQPRGHRSWRWSRSTRSIVRS